MKKDISANLYQKCLILGSKIMLRMLHNTSLKVLLPWQNTGFQSSPKLSSFLATFSDFTCKWCLVCMIQQAYMLVRVCDPIWRFSSSKSKTYWNKLGGDWKRVSCHGNRTFTATGVFPVELLACQVSMVCTAKWPRQLHLYTWDNIGLSVWRHQSSHLHILPSFQT